MQRPTEKRKKELAEPLRPKQSDEAINLSFLLFLLLSVYEVNAT